MTHSEKKAEFISRISDCAGLIHKIAALYTDRKEDGEDLMQEILYQSWKSYPSYSNKSKFSTWLYKVGLNTALVYRRNKSRMNTDSLNDEDIEKSDSSHFPNDEKMALMTAIKELSKTDRLIITFYLEGYNYKEIAEITGLSNENSATRIHRIKTKLIVKLKNIA
ncbi:MAG: sigma-70 family RNA polymerase sigma factor [Marinilabiliales bacterium]|nr:MAG: sigma-70 family RNA polymerase sigma factor [Marinilabiliales bacterium]